MSIADEHSKESSILNKFEDDTTVDVKTVLENEGSGSESNVSVLSKRQQKKLLKLEQYEIKKKEKRLKEREKNKLKKLACIQMGLPTRTGPSRKALKNNKPICTENSLKVIVDLDFDEMMIPKDFCKCVKQLLRIYTINRRAKRPGQLYFAGIKKDGNVHKALERNEGYQNWDVNWMFEPWSKVTTRDKFIYLTSDSEEVLKEVNTSFYYIIGGLVDHNHHKGFCLNRAQNLGIRTARLPLSEHVEMKTRSVLSTYHVYEILLQVSQGKDWRETIMSVLPMRKGAKPIAGTSVSSPTHKS